MMTNQKEQILTILIPNKRLQCIKLATQTTKMATKYN